MTGCEWCGRPVAVDASGDLARWCGPVCRHQFGKSGVPAHVAAAAERYRGVDLIDDGQRRERDRIDDEMRRQAVADQAAEDGR